MPEDSEDVRKIETQSSELFVTPGIILFIDSLLISAGNWLYWLVITRITLPSEIGIAVSVYGLVILVTTLTQLGLEYPLLKKSSIPRSPIVATSLVIESIITLAAIALVFVAMNTLYDESTRHFTWIAIGLIGLLSIDFVARFALLGLSSPNKVFIIDLIGFAIKFPTGFFLVSMSNGSLGILLAYLTEALFVTIIYSLILKRSFTFKLGSVSYFKATIYDALVNSPAKWSRMVIATMSVVVLAFLNANASDIAIFYIALMISIVMASFATSLSYMVIPVSSTSRKDLASESLRISISLTAPLTAALLVAPNFFLSLVGPDYESGATTLFVLALGIIPSSVTANIISKLNNLGNSRVLILSGVIQIVIYFLCIFSLVPIYGIIGASIAIFLAYLGSSILLLFLVDVGSSRYVIITSFSVFAGLVVGHLTNLILGNEQQFSEIVSTVIVSTVMIFALKNMTVAEAKMLIKSMLPKR